MLMRRSEQAILEKQLVRLCRREQRLLAQEPGALSRKAGEVGERVAQKLPEKGSELLKAAFAKVLPLIVERGGPLLEKAGRAAHQREIFTREQQALTERITRKGVGGFRRRANRSRFGNQLLSVAEGGTLGLLGIGLPDIPLFLGMLCKNVGEISRGYGFEQDSPGEWSYLMAVLCTGVAQGEQKREYAALCDQLGYALDANQPPPDSLDCWLARTADLLAGRMTVVKSVQGIMLVGAIGGVANGIWMGAVGKMAEIKYQKRFLCRLCRDR